MNYKCDICSMKIDRREGYTYTTSDVVTSVDYWKYYFEREAETENAYGGEGSQVGMSLSTACNFSTAWTVCKECTQLVDADMTSAKRYAANGEKPPDREGFSPSEAAIPAALGWSLVHNEWPVSIQVDEHPITHDPEAGPCCDFCRRIILDKEEQIATMPEPAYRDILNRGATFIRTPLASMVTPDGTDVWTCCAICMKRASLGETKSDSPQEQEVSKKWWQFWK